MDGPHAATSGPDIPGMNLDECIATELRRLSNAVHMGIPQVATVLGLSLADAEQVWNGVQPLSDNLLARWCHLLIAEPERVLEDALWLLPLRDLSDS